MALLPFRSKAMILTDLPFLGMYNEILNELSSLSKTISLLIIGKGYLEHLLSIEVISQENLHWYSLSRLILLGLMLFFGVSLLFHLAPAKRKKWRNFTPGTIFSTIFIIITSLLFSYYINNFSKYNQIYGSIGTLIIILLWIYFNAIILLTGFELNVSILNASKQCYNDALKRWKFKYELNNLDKVLYKLELLQDNNDWITIKAKDLAKEVEYIDEKGNIRKKKLYNIGKSKYGVYLTLENGNSAIFLPEVYKSFNNIITYMNKLSLKAGGNKEDWTKKKAMAKLFRTIEVK